MEYTTIDQDGFKLYWVTYTYGGQDWSFRFPARAIDDAQARLAVLKYAVVEGEIKPEIKEEESIRQLVDLEIAKTANEMQALTDRASHLATISAGLHAWKAEMESDR